MYSLNSHGNMYGVTAQDDSDMSSVGLAVITGSTDSSVCNFTAASTITNSTSSPNQSLQDLCHWYGGFGNLDTISKVCEGDFLHEYAISCGYKLSECFLSAMNKHKINFINKIDSILIGLYSSFYEDFKDLECINMAHLMNKYCSSFSKCAYSLRSKCVYILQYEVIPVTIKSIFDSKVDVNSERDMTYSEMEQLFLHFVATLDKLIMVKIMKYWRDFCRNKRKYIASLVSDVDYSNPFICAYNFDRTSAPNITCPLAFNGKFGEYISFIAIAKIDDMVEEFVGKCNDLLKGIISSRCSCMYNYIDRVCGDPKELRDEFKVLIKEEFSQSIIKEGIKDKFVNFLKNAVIWNVNNDLEVTRSWISDRIIRYMRNLLVNKTTRDAYKIINNFHEKYKIVKGFHEKIGLSKIHLSLEDRWGVNIHPEDDINIISIKREFVAKSREVIRDKFCSMIKEKYEFFDGSVIGVVSWSKISKKLLPIARETVKPLIDEEYAELSGFLSNVRVVERVSTLDKSSTCTRKITSEEIDKILKIFINSIHGRNRHLFSSVWKNLVNSVKFDTPGDIGSGSELGESEKDIVSIANPVLIPSVDGVNSLGVVPQVQNKATVIASMPVDLANKRDKIFNMWRLNLHPNDDGLIYFIRRKCSNQIKSHLTRLFSGMLRCGTVLPSGKVPQFSSWTPISRELSGIAIKSVGSIIEEQYEELSRVISKSRVLDVDESNYLSYFIREVTDDEKKDIMGRAKKLIDKRLNSSIRKSWLCAVNKYSPEIVYSYREKSKNISVSNREERWGVKLRHIDNLAILNTRRKFSSKIRNIVYNKFSSMVINKHKFDDDTFIGAFAWFRLSKKLSPIAKEEIAPIIEMEKKELENIISKSRVLIDLECDRELTAEEKSTVFKNVINIVCNSALNCLFRSVWDDVISSCAGSVDIDNYVATTSSNVNFTNEVPVSSTSMENTVEVDEGEKDHNLRINLCYEDDIDILNTRRKFSSEICSCIRDKYSRMLQGGYKFDDGTTIGMYPWKKISKKLLPVLIKETDPLVEKERKKISDMLLKSRVYISLPDSHSTTRITRELRPDERSAVLETVMKSVHKSVKEHLSQIWREIIESPSLSLKYLMEVHRSELDDIRLEFFGILGSIVDEVVDSLYPDVTNTSDSRSLYRIDPNISNIVSERSRNLFKEGGFLNRVELSLSYAKVIDISGNCRLVTNEEKKLILKEFMDIIWYDRDCLIKKRASRLESRCKRKRGIVTV